jgi:flagellum-specific peptidoglycan hydrolase FlgJ
MFDKIKNAVATYFPDFNVINFLVFMSLGLGAVLLLKDRFKTVDTELSTGDETTYVESDAPVKEERLISGIIVDSESTQSRSSRASTPKAKPQTQAVAIKYSSAAAAPRSQQLSDVRVSENAKAYDAAFLKRWHNVAIYEQNLNDVPYSILIALGMIKSSSGTSLVSKNANNFFHVTGTMGGGYSFTENGSTKKYNKYPSAWASWRAYSTILSEKYADAKNIMYLSNVAPKKSGEYSYDIKLREMKKHWNTPYKRWAYFLDLHNLDNDPNFANRLIKLIETYNLQKHDRVPID